MADDLRDPAEERLEHPGDPRSPAGAPPAEREPAEPELARGRGWTSPFALLGSVAALVWGVAAVVIAAALLIWWLA
jgi:hypothetical protein